MPARDTPDFYREEAARLTLIACDLPDPTIRLQLLQIAGSFRALVDFVAAHHNVVIPADSESV